jgi:hypothetical protein
VNVTSPDEEPTLDIRKKYAGNETKLQEGVGLLFVKR